MSSNSTADQTEQTVLRRAWRRLGWPVWNHDHGRLRAPLRAVLPVVGTVVVLAIVQSAVRARFDHPVREPVETIGLAVVLAGSVLVSSRLVDRRPIAEYGLSLDRQWWRSFAVGGLVATLINAGAVAVALGAGWVTVDGVAQTPGEVPFLPAMAIVFGYVGVAATWEEFIFRETLLKNVAEAPWDVCDRNSQSFPLSPSIASSSRSCTAEKSRISASTATIGSSVASRRTRHSDWLRESLRDAWLSWRSLFVLGSLTAVQLTLRGTRRPQPRPALALHRGRCG